VKSWRKIHHANGNQKRVGVAILISDNMDFQSKSVKGDKDGHSIVIKDSILFTVPNTTVMSRENTQSSERVGVEIFLSQPPPSWDEESLKEH